MGVDAIQGVLKCHLEEAIGVLCEAMHQSDLARSRLLDVLHQRVVCKFVAISTFGVFRETTRRNILPSNAQGTHTHAVIGKALQGPQGVVVVPFQVVDRHVVFSAECTEGMRFELR